MGVKEKVSNVGFLSAVIVVSKHPRRLVEFYRDVVGLPLVEEKDGAGPVHFGCELGDVHFAIHPIDSFPDNLWGKGSVRLAFNVFDLDELMERLKRHGVMPIFPPRQTAFGQVTAVNDPDGNYLEFTKLADTWLDRLESRSLSQSNLVAAWRRWCESR